MGYGDEAIQPPRAPYVPLDCFAALAMTGLIRLEIMPLYSHSSISFLGLADRRFEVAPFVSAVPTTRMRFMRAILLARLD